MNAKNTIIAKKRKRVERVEANLPRHSEQGPRLKKGRTREKKDRDSKKASSSARSQQYTPLNMPLEEVLMQIKDDPSLKWSEKMKGDPNKCNRNKYCRFHRDYGHESWYRLVFWFEVVDRKSHQEREVEKFPWTRSQRWEVEGKVRRAIKTST